jgi:hypothetical protein
VLSDVTMVRAYLSHAKERATAVMPLAAEITEDGDEISNALWELTSVATDLSESWPRVIGHGL